MAVVRRLCLLLVFVIVLVDGQDVNETCPLISFSGQLLARAGLPPLSFNRDYSSCHWYNPREVSCCSSDDALNIHKAAGLEYYARVERVMSALPKCWNLLSQAQCAICAPEFATYYKNTTQDGPKRISLCRGFCLRLYDACHKADMFEQLYPDCVSRDACCPETSGTTDIQCFEGNSGSSVQPVWMVLLAVLAVVAGVLQV